MAQKQFHLTVGLRNGVITNIADVERGLACDCICSACGEKLVAKKGAKMMHHFAHYAGHTCEYGYESSLHLMAKEILSNAKRIMIPTVYLHFPNSYKDDVLLCDAKEIVIDKVELEKRLGNIIPDVVVYAGKKKLLVEIYVTHCIDDEKLSKLRSADLSTIEIDLSKKENTTTVDELREILLGDNNLKTWKYNSLTNKYLQWFYRVADKREIIPRGYASHIDFCPIKARVWKGKPYANLIDDCLSCKYCISFSYEGGMLCSGRQGISDLMDFQRLISSKNKSDA